MIGDGLFEFLVALGTDAGSRIYPNKSPQKVEYPYCVYRRTGTEEHTHSTGKATMVEAGMEIACYARTYTGVKRLAKQIVDKASPFRGTMGDITVKSSFLVDQRDSFTPDPGKESGTHKRELDFDINYLEPV